MAGAMLRTVALILRFLQFIFSLTCMGIFSYFLAVLAHYNLHVLIKWRLVEAFTVLATIYTLFAIALVLCLAGSKVFGFIAIFFDIFFIGCFIAVAWLTRHGAYQCNGLVQTPVGDGLSQYAPFGNSNISMYRPSLGQACRLNRAVFALAIILIFLFLATAILQLLMSRSKKDKRYASNEKDYNSTQRSSKTPIWKRNRRAPSRESSRRRSHKERDLAAAGTAGAVGSRGVSGRRSGDSGSTLDDNTYNRDRDPKHHEAGLRPGHTPIAAPIVARDHHDRDHHDRDHSRHGHHNHRADGTYAHDDPAYATRNDPNAPIHSVTVHSPTTTTTTTTHMPNNPVGTRNSSRGRRGAPGYTTEDSHGHTHVPGFNTPLTQHTPYHEITTQEQRDQEALRNQNAALGQTGYGQRDYDITRGTNILPGQTGTGLNTIGNQREYHDTTRGTNILPSQSGNTGLNTIGNQRDYDNRMQPGYDQNQAGYTRDIGNQRDFDNTRRSGDYNRRDITPGRDTTLGRDRDITPGRSSNRNTLVNSRDYDNTNFDQNNYGRDNTLGRDQAGFTRGNVTRNQSDFDNNMPGQFPNTSQGYNDSYNRDPSFNRTPSAGRVRRF